MTGNGNRSRRVSEHIAVTVHHRVSGEITIRKSIVLSTWESREWMLDSRLHHRVRTFLCLCLVPTNRLHHMRNDLKRSSGCREVEGV